MASKTIIPRFLLPQQSPLWRGLSGATTSTSTSAAAAVRRNAVVRIRFASTRSGKPDKHTVLEKPAKFNPPSHGSRLKRGTGSASQASSSPASRHYGPSLSAGEVAEQNQRHYPGLMAPKGSWSHWFWHSKGLHTCITMGTLLAMAIFTFFMNYATNSLFKDLVPPISDLWRSPLAFFAAWRNVIVLHEKEKAERAQEHRFQGLDDAAKRRYFMKMHGIEQRNPVHIVFGKPEESEAALEAAALGTEPPTPEGDEANPRKKWLGIF